MEQKAITPEEFLAKMKKLAENTYEEYFHINADELICDVLRSLGYGDGVEVFERHPKWYS